MINHLNSPWLTAITLAGFIYLAWYSQQPCNQYPLADACENGVFTPQPVRSDRDTIIMHLWNLTERDVAAPVVLW